MGTRPAASSSSTSQYQLPVASTATPVPGCNLRKNILNFCQSCSTRTGAVVFPFSSMATNTEYFRCASHPTNTRAAFSSVCPSVMLSFIAAVISFATYERVLLIFTSQPRIYGSSLIRSQRRRGKVMVYLRQRYGLTHRDSHLLVSCPGSGRPTRRQRAHGGRLQA
jgi:hypothetical protein